ncbi:MAG: hypothetical protein WCY92_13110 [Novosphingobium sp.]
MMRQLAPIISKMDQTEFKLPGGYVPGSLIVTVNGIVLQPADFEATDGRTVRLVAELGEADELGGIVFGDVRAECAD